MIPSNFLYLVNQDLDYYDRVFLLMCGWIIFIIDEHISSIICDFWGLILSISDIRLLL